MYLLSSRNQLQLMLLSLCFQARPLVGGVFVRCKNMDMHKDT